MESKKVTITPNVFLTLKSKRDSAGSIQVTAQKPLKLVSSTMRSVYWKHFAFPAKSGGNIMCKSKILCLLCKRYMTYSNAGNLRAHLLSRHKKELLELERPTPKGAIEIEHKVESNVESSPNFSSMYIDVPELEKKVDVFEKSTAKTLILGNKLDPFHSNETDPLKCLELKRNNVVFPSMEDCKMWNLVLRLMVTDLYLPDIIEEPGFHNIVGSLRRPIAFPDKSKIEKELLHKVYYSVRNIVSKTLSKTVNLGLTLEEWKNNNGQFFVTFTVHYVTSDDVFESRVLRTLHAPKNWKESQWSSAMSQFLQAWDIDSRKITAVIVASEREELFTALEAKGFIVIPCFAHVMKISAQAFFEIPAVSEVIEKCRNIIGMIYTNAEIEDVFVSQQKMLQIEQSSLFMDHASDWMSTLNMLEQIVAKKEAILSVLRIMQEADFENMELTAEGWNLVENVINILGLLKVTSTTLIEENIPVVSLMIPLQQQLISSSTDIKEENGCSSRNLNEFLLETFNKYGTNERNIKFLQIATTLDPRVKEFSHATFVGQRDVFTLVQEAVDEQVKKDAKVITVKDFGQLATKKRRTGMEKLLGDVYSAVCKFPAEEKTDIELIQYRAEPLAPLNVCPSKWWSNMFAKFPKLGKLSRKYQCVPVCCTTSRRVTADGYFSYVAKRATLPAHIVDKLLFLNANSEDIKDFEQFFQES